MKIIITDFNGEKHELEALAGWRAMEVIRDWNLPIKAECGGCCCCATCHVYVAERWLNKLPEPSIEEEQRLDEAFAVQDNSRLSCQIILSTEMDGLELQMAPGSEKD